MTTLGALLTFAEEDPGCALPVSTGSLREGEACVAGLECADELLCELDAVGELVCQPPARVGEACRPGQLGVARNCAEGLVCRASTAQCVTLGALGAACINSNDCVNNAFCNDDVCTPKAAAGESCADFGCASELSCGPGQICVAPIADGAPCEARNICEASCSICRRTVEGGPLTCGPPPAVGESCDSVCQPDAFCLNTICAAKLSADAACNPGECGEGLSCIESLCREVTSDCLFGGECAESGAFCSSQNDCAGEALCTNGRCQTLPALGETCLQGRCAFGSLCNNVNTCAALLAQGESCTENRECLSSECSSGQCSAPPYGCSGSKGLVPVLLFFSLLFPLRGTLGRQKRRHERV